MSERRMRWGLPLPAVFERPPRRNDRDWPDGQPAERAESLVVYRWIVVASLAFLSVQADRAFQHAGLSFPALLLTPGCLLPFCLWWGPRCLTAAVFGAAASIALAPDLQGFAVPSPWIMLPIRIGGLAFELWLSSRLLQQWRFRVEMDRGRDVAVLLAAALVGTSVSGWLAMPVILWSEPLSTLKLFQTCGIWWLMHAVSVIVLTPAWLAWAQDTRDSVAELLTAAVFGLVILASAAIGFDLWRPAELVPDALIFFGLPMLVLAPLLTGARGAAVVTVLASLTAAYATAVARGPLHSPDPLAANFGLCIYLIALASTTYSVSAIISERRHALARLELDHSLLASAEKITGTGSWQYDVATGAQQWSDGLYRLLKLLPGEVPPDIQVFQERFVVREDLQRFRQSWDSFLRSGQPDSLEYRVVRTDGSQRVFCGQAEMQRDHHGAPLHVTGTVRDVTDLRRAEDLKERMQFLLTKAEEIANLGSWEVDGTGDMRMWSDNMYRICGIDPDKFDGRFDTFVERLVHPEDREQLTRKFQEFAAAGGIDSGVFRIVRGDGQVRELHARVQVHHRQNGQLSGCFGTTTDVTERKRAERRLRESEQRYRLLAEHASDLIVCIGEGGRLTYVSPASRKILGFEPSELTGRRFKHVVDPQDRDECHQALNALFAGGERSSLLFRGVRKDGLPVWLESKAQLVVDDHGRRELLCVIRDITQRRQLEEQIAAAQRLEAVGRLAGGVAHDFNNILLVINGYTEILASRFAADDPASKYVASILEAGRRAADLTRQLLTYSRKQIVTRCQVDFNEVIGKLEPLLRPLMGEGIEVVCRLTADIGLVEGDLRQFEQLLMNLAINARDAMPEGGRLTFQTENVVFAVWDMRPGKLAAGRYVKVTVQDTGVGMDDLVRARLFEPFFTTKGAGQGTGLGLATAYAAMEQIGGAILVESAPGAGSRFELYFPARERPVVAAPAATATSPTANAGSDRRILVVEDDPDVQALVELTLHEAGYDVVVASDADEALGAVARTESAFDLLLTDVVMKGINGRELADRIRLSHPQLPVIFMSGHTEDSVVRCGVLNDEVALLHKPFTAAELKTRVEHSLSEQVR